MGEPNKLEIQISTTGADSAVSDIKKVKDEELSFQEQRIQRNKGVSFDQAVFVDSDKAEAASRRAAAAASNAAAAEEAAAVRAERAAAARSAAFAADATMREKAAARHIAAVAAEAEADAAAAAKEAMVNEKRMGMLARRGAMMLGGSERAVLVGEEAGLAATGTSISASIGKLATNPVVLAAAVAIGIVTASVYALTKEIDNVADAEKEAAKVGIVLSESQKEQFRAMENGAAGYATKIKESVSGAWQFVKDTWHNIPEILTRTVDYMYGGERQMLEEQIAWASAAKHEAFIKENADLIKHVAGIEAENKAMSEQERQINRLVALKEKLNGQENTAARQEVELAKLKGGDVALAEANALSTEMRTALDGLNNKLVLARQAVNKAAEGERNAADALFIYQKGVADDVRKENKEEYDKLKKAAEDANKKYAEARESLQDQNAAFGGAQKNILRKTEIDLEKKEDEYSGQTSTAASKAFQKVYQSLKDEVAKGPTEAIAQIQVEVGTITTSANAKATEINTALSTERTGTIAAIQTLAPTAASSSAIVAAVSQAKDAVNAQTQVFISSIGQISSAVIANSNRLAAQQAQIAQLFARIR